MTKYIYWVHFGVLKLGVLKFQGILGLQNLLKTSILKHMALHVHKPILENFDAIEHIICQIGFYGTLSAKIQSQF